MAVASDGPPGNFRIARSGRTRSAAAAAATEAAV